MGKKIYLGTMIEALKTQIDAMATKLDTQITALGVHTTKLGEISAGISQGLSSINVKSGTTDKSVVLNTVAKNTTMTATGTSYSLLLGFKAFCDGVVRFDCMVSTNANINSNIGYSINGAAAVYPLADFATTATPIAKNIDIPVKFGDSVQIMCKTPTTTGKIMTIAENSTIKYDLIDIVSEGALTLSGL